jgi:cytochrome c
MFYKLKSSMALLAAAMLSQQAFAADELAAAKALATNHCAACHTFGKGEPPGQGPNLFGLIGRKAGSAEGFTYSEGFRKAMEGKTWDAKLLDRWLTDTQAVAPGNGMTYFQDDAAKRRKLIRYLETLK